MNILQKYDRHWIGVTELSAQLWCEKQLEFRLEYGRIETQEMRDGQKRHEELHEEIVAPVEIKPSSFEDSVALDLCNCIVGLTLLTDKGITREFRIWGKVNALPITGYIDELILKDGGLKIIDTKTRKKHCMPTEAQKKSTRFQLMLYKYLLASIQKGKYTPKDLLDAYNFDKKSKMTEDFRKQISIELELEVKPEIFKLTEEVFSGIRRLPSVSDGLEVRYEHQDSKAEIGVDKFKFDQHDFKQTCDFAEEFWTGRRKAIPVDGANKWKCNYCEFRQRCFAGVAETFSTPPQTP